MLRTATKLSGCHLSLLRGFIDEHTQALLRRSSRVLNCPKGRAISHFGEPNVALVSSG
jgi:hypothetical protein